MNGSLTCFDTLYSNKCYDQGISGTLRLQITMLMFTGIVSFYCYNPVTSPDNVNFSAKQKTMLQYC